MITVVTALIDIGRGTWSTKHKRSIEEYLDLFSNVCKLENNMVIWTTADLVPKVRELRRGKENSTMICVCSPNDFVLNNRKSDIDRIMENNKSRKYYHDQAHLAPEFNSSEYVILVNNKIEFMRRAAMMCDDYIVWVDAGYSFKTFDMTGKHVVIPDKHKDKVYMCKLWKWPFESEPLAFQCQWPLDVLDGGFVSIDTKLMAKFADLYYSLINEILDHGIIDDDQFFMTMMYVRYPDLFSLEDGDWFGGCKYILAHS
jgi:protein YibB